MTEAPWDEKSRRLYNLRLRHQGFRTYHPVGLVVLMLLDFLFVVCVSPFVGAFVELKDGLSGWWSASRGAITYLVDRYSSTERFERREKARQERFDRKFAETQARKRERMDW